MPSLCQVSRSTCTVALWGELAQCSENVIAGAQGDAVCGVPFDQRGQIAIAEHCAAGVPVEASVRLRDAVWIVVREGDLREVGKAATSGSFRGRTKHHDNAGSDPHLLKSFQQIRHGAAPPWRRPQTPPIDAARGCRYHFSARFASQTSADFSASPVCNTSKHRLAFPPFLHVDLKTPGRVGLHDNCTRFVCVIAYADER